MKAANFALVALAGFGLVTSQLAYADTLPGAATPSVSHVRPMKIVRLAEKRHGATSEAMDTTGFLLTGLAGGAIGFGGGLLTKKQQVVVFHSTGT